jgi:DNA-directed RNA polymerase subunit RPC12/RpoP
MPNRKITTKPMKCSHCKQQIKAVTTYYEFPIPEEYQKIIKEPNIQCLDCNHKWMKEIVIINRIRESGKQIKELAQDMIDIEKYPASNRIKVIYIPTGFTIFDLSMDEYEEHLEINGGSISKFKDFAGKYYYDELEYDDPKALFGTTLIDSKKKIKVKNIS